MGVNFVVSAIWLSLPRVQPARYCRRIDSVLLLGLHKGFPFLMKAIDIRNMHNKNYNKRVCSCTKELLVSSTVYTSLALIKRQRRSMPFVDKNRKVGSFHFYETKAKSAINLFK
ncbi:hypothetical protein HAX54_015861 [Datura stramonium]|uniref:Uncharacterized protein n=1 Tax=Datura stramonium TaxID=4076 RepID=A0ABS8UHV4_DATST|nr:hypothetical protein [Datura stramonium]